MIDCKSGRAGDGDSTSTRLEALIAAAMDAIVSVDDSFAIIGFNPAAEDMFGVTADHVLGQSLEQFIPRRFRVAHRSHVDRFIRTGLTHRRMGALGEVSAVRASGEEFPVEATISHAAAGGESFSTVILRDISLHQATEAAMLLAREVDHRAKNILAVVASLIELTSAPSQAEYAQSLAGRVAALSRANMLLASERWSGASLAQLAEDELSSFASPGQSACEGPDLRLSARAVQPVGMLLHELATNAVKHGAFSALEGHVSLRWSREQDGMVRLVWQERGGPPVIAPPAGTVGFGTSLIRMTIRNQLGGRLETHWDPAGMTLDVHLPAELFQQPADQDPASDWARDAGPVPPELEGGLAGEDKPAAGTVLIVEDEPLLALQLSRGLSDFGWEVLGVAGSIDEANQLLRDVARPDVVLLDVDLGGEPVFPLARTLRGRGIPFVFCTGYEDIGYNREFANSTILRKPATVLQIVTAMHKVIDASGKGVAGAQVH